METVNGTDAMVEGIISLWRITSTGQLMKDKELTFNYRMPFAQTKQGRMKLELSHDRKIITLGCQ
jgi:hypothetical protein